MCSQWRCPGGVTCENGHGFGEASDFLEYKPTVYREYSRGKRAEEGSTDRRRSVEPEANAGQSIEEFAESASKIPRIGDYERVIERIFDVDVEGDYERMERALKIEGAASRADYATLVDALNEAEDNARVAHRLFVNAEIAKEAFEIDAEIVMTDMRAQALAGLQAEKSEGARSKAITDADVRSEMARLFPDEWRTLATKRKKVDGMTDHLKRCAELLKSRASSLETMIRTRR